MLATVFTRGFIICIDIESLNWALLSIKSKATRRQPLNGDTECENTKIESTSGTVI